MNDFKFLRKEECFVLLTVVLKVCRLFYMYKLVVCVRLPSKIFYQTLSRKTIDARKNVCVYELVIG